MSADYRRPASFPLVETIIAHAIANTVALVVASAIMLVGGRAYLKYEIEKITSDRPAAKSR